MYKISDMGPYGSCDLQVENLIKTVKISPKDIPICPPDLDNLSLRLSPLVSSGHVKLTKLSEVASLRMPT